MRGNYLMHGGKPQGIIIRKSQQKAFQEPPRTLSVQQPMINNTMTHYTTITSNESIKIPGEIRRLNRASREQVDQEVYYNADVYKSISRSAETVTYSQSETLLPIKKVHREVIAVPATHSLKIEQLQSIEEQNPLVSLNNIHGNFDIQKYSATYRLLKDIVQACPGTLFEVSAALGAYARQSMHANICHLDDLKIVYTKKELVKQCFVRQRQAVVAVCLTIVVGKFDKMRSYCSNLLKAIFENNLLSLHAFAQNSSEVDKLINQAGKEHLLGKGYGLMRSINDQIVDLITKIVRIDPLFAQEYYKIKANYNSTSTGPFLLALLSFFAFYVHACKADNLLPFLSLAPRPYIAVGPAEEYTLVIDFMRVFLDQSRHCKKGRGVREVGSLRPNTAYFLKEMSKYYQIVSFCDYMPVECNKIINKIDELGVVKHRLYKFHIDRSTKHKEIAKLGRVLQKTILIDTVEPPDHRNLLQISPWKGDTANAQLAEICPVLAMIAVKRLPAQQSLRKIREAVQENSSLGLKYINCGLNL